MIEPPPLASLPVSNISGAAAQILAAGSRAAAPGLLFGAESAQVSLSGIAQRALTRLANDPSLDIDTAFQRSVLDLTQEAANDGQLFSSTGQLQPFIPSPRLPQAPSAPNGTVDTQAPLDTLLGTAPATPIIEEALLNLPGTTNQPAVTTASNDTLVAAPVPTPANSADAQSPATPGDATPEAAPATAAAPAAVAPTVTPPAAGTPPPIVAAATDTPAAIAAQTMAAARDIDPFQQAALIAGLTSFGKELNDFRAGTPDDDTGVQGLAAVRPVRERRDQSTEAWLQSRQGER